MIQQDSKAPEYQIQHCAVLYHITHDYKRAKKYVIKNKIKEYANTNSNLNINQRKF